MIQNLRNGEIKLNQWNIVVFDDGHEVYEKFLGYEASSDSFHISSKILDFDKVAGTAKTKTHAYYSLIGEPGELHPKAKLIFKKLNSIKGLRVFLKYS